MLAIFAMTGGPNTGIGMYFSNPYLPMHAGAIMVAVGVILSIAVYRFTKLVPTRHNVGARKQNTSHKNDWVV